MPKGNEVAAQSGKTLNKLRGSLILEIRKKKRIKWKPNCIYLFIHLRVRLTLLWYFKICGLSIVYLHLLLVLAVCVFYLRDWDTVKEQNSRAIFFWTHVFRCLAINLIHSQFWFLSPLLPSSCELERKLLQRYVHFMFQFKALCYCSFAPRLQSICVWMSLCFWLSLDR